MKKFLLTALKFLLLILLFVAAAVGAYALAQYLNWPWWGGACLFGGFIGLVAAILFFRKWLLRRREKRFVKRIIDHDASAIAAAPVQERHRLQELQDRWAEAVALLGRSELRKRGNPLYVLPWYMVFGESDSGKTTAVASSRLTSILTDVGPTPGVSATKNCDWWFFEEAVILDTAGRYAIPLDDSRDKEEWERFLTLLVKYRRKEPLNGLIVTLPADRLLKDGKDALTEYGRSIRRRVDELMRVLGARFPVYVLVTKMDLVFGLTGLIDTLPEQARTQAMGMVNEAGLTDPDEFVTRAVTSVTDRLRELRLLLLDGSMGFDPAFLLFSDELTRLRPQLSAFAEGAFEDNPYQEAPLFRGLFFSSGEQSGVQTSGLLDTLVSTQGLDKSLPGTTRGYFLHDFFAKVLPRDRNLFTPLLEFLKWKLLTRNLGMAAWLLLLFFLCGLLSLSYIGNMRAMAPLFADFPSRPQFSEKSDDRVVELFSFRQHILDLNTRNQGWWIPRMGLDVSLETEARLKALFCTDFNTLVLQKLDDRVNTALSRLTAKSPERLTSEFVRLVVWRIDLIQARLAGGSLKDMEHYQIPTTDALAEAYPDLSTDLMGYFSKMYVSYLLWTEDLEGLKEKQLMLKARLGKVLALKGTDFKWLVDWANENPGLKSVSLRDFWGGPMVPDEGGPHVPSAYTEDGYQLLLNFLAELKSAVDNPHEFDKEESAFWAWYADQYYRSWYDFCGHFLQGEGQLLTKSDYTAMAATMATMDNPYFKLLERMKDAFTPLKAYKTPPAWINRVFHFNIVLGEYQASKAKGVEEASEAAKSSLRKVIADVGGKFATDVGKHLEVSQSLDDYMQVLGDIAHYADNKEDAFKAATALYPGDVGGGASGGAGAGAGGGGAAPAADGQSKSPIDAAKQAVSTMKAVMGQRGAGEDMFWNLVTGPLDFIVYVITLEASCQLQELWEGQVLAEVSHVPQNKLREKLFGDSGVVNKFTDGAAKPFLARDVSGWKAKSWYGVPFPFQDDFFPFLDSGAQGAQAIQPEYKVEVSAVPTSVNDGAKADPYATLLVLECGTKPQSLANFNYQESLVFDWKPAECGTTTLSIQFPGLELTRTYEGQNGFAEFLKEFRQGSVTYTAKDFPDQQKGLEGLGITEVKVAYEFKDAGPVIDLLNIKPLSVPDTITDCWQR